MNTSFHLPIFQQDNYSISIRLVIVYQFEPAGTDSTLFKVSVHAAGEVEEGVPAIVERVWEHFIFKQLKPYVEAGKHLTNKE